MVIHFHQMVTKNDGLLCQRVNMRDRFIQQEVSRYPLTVLCHVFQVSWSEYDTLDTRDWEGTEAGSAQVVLAVVQRLYQLPTSFLYTSSYAMPACLQRNRSCTLAYPFSPMTC